MHDTISSFYWHILIHFYRYVSNHFWFLRNYTITRQKSSWSNRANLKDLESEVWTHHKDERIWFFGLSYVISQLYNFRSTEWHPCVTMNKNQLFPNQSESKTTVHRNHLSYLIGTNNTGWNIKKLGLGELPIRRAPRGRCRVTGCFTTFINLSGPFVARIVSFWSNWTAYIITPK